jgi:hypothetical protein
VYRITSSTLALFFLPALAYAQEPRKKLDVIVIITDDQRWNAFSLAGHKQSQDAEYRWLSVGRCASNAVPLSVPKAKLIATPLAWRSP